MAGESLVVSFSNAGGSDLRVQLSTLDGATYCEELFQVQSPATLELGQFNSACWDNSGSFLPANTPVSSIQLVVPSTDTGDVAFEFCLFDVSTQ